ncbi:ABC transporter permease [Streptomyces adelaidensis]|uniref:ABC transporter permease n=1 Tax=Streptomyces adelaidensis TaxID=2796465 RepID=UPI001906A41F|nr:ABC transporter permease [Streptomyces adelaidensis]
MSALAERAEHAAPVEAAEGYRAGGTLPLRVELVRQLKRRRTMVMGAVLFALPIILVIAFWINGAPGEGNTQMNLMDSATASAANFAAVNLFSAASFLLVIPVALFCGDTVASEAGWSSLRYLLAAPVPRARLLWSKLVVGLTLSLAAMVLLPIVALAIGTVAYGWGPLELPTGGELGSGAAAWAMLVSVGYIFVSQLVTAALAFWLSTRTDAPLGAVGGAVGLTIIGSVLNSVTALGDWRDFLPAHWQYAWLDVVNPQPDYTTMIQGISISISYALVLFALAFRGFGRKDVVS